MKNKLIYYCLVDAGLVDTGLSQSEIDLYISWVLGYATDILVSKATTFTPN